MGGRARGRVVDNTGTPLVGVSVQATAAPPVGLTLDGVIYDLYGPPFWPANSWGWGDPWGRNDVLLGVNTGYDWRVGVVRNNNWGPNIPATYTAFSNWGQVVQGPNGVGPTRNFRVHVRYIRLYMLRTSTGWTKVRDSQAHGIGGSYYTTVPSYTSVAGGNWRAESEGHSSLWTSNTSAHLLHFWAPGRVRRPTDLLGLYTVAQLRLIQNTGGADLSRVEVYGCSGHDYQLDLTSPPPGPGGGIARHKRLTGQWQYFTFLAYPTPPAPRSAAGYNYVTPVRNAHALYPIPEVV